MLQESSVPDELVKDCRTLCCFPQHHGAAVARQQQLLEHVALHGEHQAVGLDHLHLVRVGGLHTQGDVAAVPHGQQALQTLHQAHGVVQHCGPGVQHHVLLQGCCGDVEQTHKNSFRQRLSVRMFESAENALLDFVPKPHLMCLEAGWARVSFQTWSG